jgi:NitT/TauT family transport system substrate-binding protein
VPKDSPIKTAADLNGKTIAVNALKSVGDVTIREAARKAGADPSTFKFSEIDFPDMLTAVQQKRIDAIWEVEPFVTLAKSQGMRVIVEPFTGTEPNLTVSTWFASQSYISDHKDVIDRFVRAMNRSLEYSEAHPDAVRKVLPTFTSIKPDLATKIALPHFTTDLNVPSIELTAKLMKEFGITDAEPDVAKLVGNGG